MSNGFLSQEEIDALLNGGQEDENTSPSEVAIESEDGSELSDVEKDLLGEIGNISMGSASTALSTIINQQVNITTPVVTLTTLRKLKDEFEIPNVALEVKYTAGIIGENLLVMKVTDAYVIANLMMGGEGKIEGEVKELGEIETSAVSEAMNQMIGSAATSMATMFMREINISPPVSNIWDDGTEPLSQEISEDETIIKVSFSLKIGELVDSHIMQLFPVNTAKKIIAIMMGKEEEEKVEDKVEDSKPEAPVKTENTSLPSQSPQPQVEASNNIYEKPIETNINKQPVEVQKAVFQSLDSAPSRGNIPRNIDLILDVPLEISVVLGRTKKSIKDILNLGTGSLVELDKLTEEPVEILVNGKKVAYGEVIVIDENFGVRIKSIISSEDRISSLK
ncbi:flagellar motor switch phosphatase FliY [Clostridium kluyveri]|uniref:Flagellar motor switch phosphatase FliY n=1 Tax=Clostridium kluyveri TaxID=1534 RepID=A0A1L5F8J6_CLOKL|nr:flagellar motor switch phosphatase FliY [Clostridium kluyveri]APM39307.1 flagellar motor switch phosphatase FliY [Clostridium kluyveri]UZQ50507.1 flagellar motor switch phosphatase FliY [Clostridium kluyveri]